MEYILIVDFFDMIGVNILFFCKFDQSYYDLTQDWVPFISRFTSNLCRWVRIYYSYSKL
jgi:hypothetical protein